MIASKAFHLLQVFCACWFPNAPLSEPLLTNLSLLTSASKNVRSYRAGERDIRLGVGNKGFPSVQPALGNCTGDRD